MVRYYTSTSLVLVPYVYNHTNKENDATQDLISHRVQTVRYGTKLGTGTVRRSYSITKSVPKMRCRLWYVRTSVPGRFGFMPENILSFMSSTDKAHSRFHNVESINHIFCYGRLPGTVVYASIPSLLDSVQGHNLYVLALSGCHKSWCPIGYLHIGFAFLYLIYVYEFS